jgi:hypothetical protein
VELAGLKIREEGIGPESHHEAAGPGLAASPLACRCLGRRPGRKHEVSVFNRPHDRLTAPRSVRIRAICTSAIPHTMKGSPEPMSSLASAFTVPRTARLNLDGLIDEILSRCR